MQTSLSTALTHFADALHQVEAALAQSPVLQSSLLEGTEDWRRLLRFKLLPHLGGEGCLVAAVAGGTNTGKSTVFNLLLGEDTSPVRSTAAATCHPVLAGNQRRCEECLEGLLVPEFQTMPLSTPEAPLERDAPPEVLYVTCNPTLPDHLVLLDIPDVDSIERKNWEVAKNVRETGDVLIAVLTGEKYKDAIVVQFFREALSTGRMVVPLMNKANPENDYEIAREQLRDFCSDVGVEEAALFVLPHDFGMSKNFSGRSIASLNGNKDLRAFLETLEVAPLKEQVYRGSVRSFSEQAGSFVARVEEKRSSLQEMIEGFEGEAAKAAKMYVPAPGVEVRELLHDCLQGKRGTLDRAVGKVSRTIIVGGRKLRRSIFRTGETTNPEAVHSDRKAVEENRHKIENILHLLLNTYFEQARRLPQPFDQLVESGLRALDTGSTASSLAETMMSGDSISDQFRAHVDAQMRDWGRRNKFRRGTIIAVEQLSTLGPLAAGAGAAIHFGGFGGPEVAMVLAPLAGQVAWKAMLYQFGPEHIYNVLAPWYREQQDALAQALIEQVNDHILRDITQVLNALPPQLVADLRRWQQQCQQLAAI